MIRRGALEAVGGFRDGPFPEDYDLWLRFDAAGYGLAKVDMLGLKWRTTLNRATFSDPRYASARIVETRARYLAIRLARTSLPICVWGAGKTGRRLARALEANGVRTAMFVDIDPLKIGRTARDAPIVPPDAVLSQSSRAPAHMIVIAVGARGARAIVEGRLNAAAMWQAGTTSQAR